MIPHLPEPWRSFMASELNKPYFTELLNKVDEAYRSSRVFPEASQLFTAFNLCFPSEVKVVILGQDPYHGPGQAHGLAFSVPEGMKIPPSLRNIFKEIEQEIGSPYPASGNLKRWAMQGVLLLNAVLSVENGKPRSHVSFGWQKFTQSVIEQLSRNYTGIVFMLWGGDAIKMAEHIDASRHLVLTAPHPSPLSAYRGFFGCNHFAMANDYLINSKKQPIQW